MRKAKDPLFFKEVVFAFILILWALTAWLLYPLISLDSVDMENVKQYLYRSAMGIALMIIFFGKSVIDLLFPTVSLKKMPLLNTVLLAVYSVALAGGIVFMMVRIAALYMKSREAGLMNSDF